MLLEYLFLYFNLSNNKKKIYFKTRRFNEIKSKNNKKNTGFNSVILLQTVEKTKN